MNASSLDEGTDEEDADYQPRLKMNSQKYVYHEPRIGEQYQVDAANIPEVKDCYLYHLFFLIRRTNPVTHTKMSISKLLFGSQVKKIPLFSTKNCRALQRNENERFQPPQNARGLISCSGAPNRVFIGQS